MTRGALVRWLQSLEARDLGEVLRRRPDALIAPSPADLVQLAGRLTTRTAVSEVVAGLPLPAVQVLEALTRLGPPPIPRTHLAEALDRAPDDTELDATLRVLSQRALAWPDGDDLWLSPGLLLELPDEDPTPFAPVPPAPALIPADRSAIREAAAQAARALLEYAADPSLDVPLAKHYRQVVPQPGPPAPDATRLAHILSTWWSGGSPLRRVVVRVLHDLPPDTAVLGTDSLAPLVRWTAPLPSRAATLPPPRTTPRPPSAAPPPATRAEATGETTRGPARRLTSVPRDDAAPETPAGAAHRRSGDATNPARGEAADEPSEGAIRGPVRRLTSVPPDGAVPATPADTTRGPSDSAAPTASSSAAPTASGGAGQAASGGARPATTLADVVTGIVAEATLLGVCVMLDPDVFAISPFGRALADGRSVAEVASHLLPEPSLKVLAPPSVIVADDPALLDTVTDALPELDRLAPTVAAAPSSADDTLAALREAGFHASTEAAKVTVTRPPSAARPAPSQRSRPAVDPVELAARLTVPLQRDASPLEQIRHRAPQLRPEQAQLLADAVEHGTPVWIRYVDANGRASERVIENAELAGSTIEAWCRLRRDERAFTLDKIVAVARPRH
ncbi:hypothetical protein [Dactylosporangium sp. CS-033363]|uniref:WYL domain-containing protein n=1 Tax=Dactylosporangium sp. CS-033363 TaxID=3239935 RepID=UPI003D8B6B33